MPFLVSNTATIGLDQSGIIPRARVGGGGEAIPTPNALLPLLTGECGMKVGKAMNVF